MVFFASRGMGLYGMRLRRRITTSRQICSKTTPGQICAHSTLSPLSPVSPTSFSFASIRGSPVPPYLRSSLSLSAAMSSTTALSSSSSSSSTTTTTTTTDPVEILDETELKAAFGNSIDPIGALKTASSNSTIWES
eukprot:gb/GEZN01023153.1/.p1 GENE.gb/GEZN01023153.1/~~gb/GEZN01023153.1/.p1  ORF type:complete len:136 (-),score=14.62 gb/GEZN01023153.1/:40-447(-)